MSVCSPRLCFVDLFTDGREGWGACPLQAEFCFFKKLIAAFLHFLPDGTRTRVCMVYFVDVCSLNCFAPWTIFHEPRLEGSLVYEGVYAGT